MNWESEQQEQSQRTEDALDAVRIIAYGIVAIMLVATVKLLADVWFA